jgi:hypothetical protein
MLLINDFMISFEMFSYIVHDPLVAEAVKIELCKEQIRQAFFDMMCLTSMTLHEAKLQGAVIKARILAKLVSNADVNGSRHKQIEVLRAGHQQDST